MVRKIQVKVVYQVPFGGCAGGSEHLGDSALQAQGATVASSVWFPECDRSTVGCQTWKCREPLLVAFQVG